MCILVLIKKGRKISNAELSSCLKNNPDGCGIGYYVGNKQVIKKLGKTSFEKSLKFCQQALEIAYKEATSPVLFHSRIATGSVCNKRNCHPFKINDNVMMGHNGILNILPSLRCCSDTKIMATLLKCGVLDVQGDDFKEILGKNNKVVFLTPRKYKIFNEQLGHWKNGVWFSNYSYEDYKAYSTDNIYKFYGFNFF